MKRVNTTRLMKTRLKRLILNPVLSLLSLAKPLTASKLRTSLTISLISKARALTRKMRWIGMTMMTLTIAGSHLLCATKVTAVILAVIMLSLVLASLVSSRTVCELNSVSTTLKNTLERFMKPLRETTTMRLRRLWQPLKIRP